MSFPELRKYIDSELCRISSGNPNSQDEPHTKEDFLKLWQILQAKTKEHPKPVFTEFPDFCASDKLAELQMQLTEIKCQLEAKRRDPESTKRSIRKLVHKQTFAKEAYEILLHIEKKAHSELLRIEKNNYLHKETEYQNRARLIQHWKRFSDRIFRDIQTKFSSANRIKTEKIFWRVLPSEDRSFDSILAHYEQLQRSNPHIPYEVGRLQSIFSLSPSKCYIGMDEFVGYIVFAFEHSKKVILECPVYGNAIYVIRDNWKGLSRLSKHELLTEHSDLVYRIVHTGGWFDKLKFELCGKTNS